MVFIISVPRHMGIIPDGNRRLARRMMKTPWKGHEMGLGKIKDVVGWCSELGVKTVTIYLLSLENLERRPRRELDFIFRLARQEIKAILEDMRHKIHTTRTRVRFFGRLDLLPADIREGIRRVETKTGKYSGGMLNLAIAYGGRQEIVNAAQKIASDAKNGRVKPSMIDEKNIKDYFWTAGIEDPDMVIRTGGEKRLSNFLPFQSTYAELFFLDKFWPELDKNDLSRAIAEFGERQRRFGK